MEEVLLVWTVDPAKRPNLSNISIAWGLGDALCLVPVYALCIALVDSLRSANRLRIIFANLNGWLLNNYLKHNLSFLCCSLSTQNDRGKTQAIANQLMLLLHQLLHKMKKVQTDLNKVKDSNCFPVIVRVWISGHSCSAHTSFAELPVHGLMDSILNSAKWRVLFSNIIFLFGWPATSRAGAAW